MRGQLSDHPSSSDDTGMESHPPPCTVMLFMLAMIEDAEMATTSSSSGDMLTVESEVPIRECFWNDDDENSNDDVI